MSPAEANRKAGKALADAAQLQPGLPLLLTLSAQRQLYLGDDLGLTGSAIALAVAAQPNDALTRAYEALYYLIVRNEVTKLLRRNV